MYPIRHVFRNWKLFTALLIGITLAATFFAGIWVKSDIASDQSFNKHLGSLKADMTFQNQFNYTNVPLVVQDILNVKGVTDVEIVSRSWQDLGFPADNYTNCLLSVPMISFPNNSRIYDEWLNKPSDGIPENYTYIITGTQLANRTAIGDVITTQMTFYQPKYDNASTFAVNLTVAGFAELTDDGYAYCTDNLRGNSIDFSGYRSDLLIIGWESTLTKMWTSTLDGCGTTQIGFIIDVDREDLISPFNIQESINNVDRVATNIQNRVLGNYLSWGWVDNMLRSALWSYNYDSQNMLNGFIMVSIPIFFVAWYLGYTVSDVSFNIRRREIGLLSTKGLSSGQIQRMFLTEALVIGLIGGLLGTFGGLLLNQYYLGTVNVAHIFSSTLLNPIVAVTTIIFAVVLAVAAVFLSARKASKIAAVDTIRIYMPPIKKKKKIFPLVALILGSYKIVIFLLGVNVQYLFNQMSFQGNMFVSVLSVPVVIFDQAMTYIGPLLFFWGFTKLVILDSTKFQAVTTKISSAMGDLGALAAKNVRRNPARLAAIAFLIALIIGLSVQVTGQIASQEDYIERNVHNNVGADISVSVANVTRSQEILSNITQNVSGIRNATIERSLTAFSVGDRTSYMSVRTIEPDAWAECAYYEDGWFSGGPSMNQMLAELKSNNNTIILDRTVAKQLDLKLYDEIAVDFSSCARQLRVVGFFGPEPQDNSNSYSYINGVQTLYSPFCSYVPRDLFNMTEGSDIYVLEYWSSKILISIEPGVNGTDVANQIRALYLDVYGVQSFDEQWRRSVEMDNLNTYNDLQILELQNFGLIFAVLSASVGTALIAIVSLKERSREATLMSVRGLSFRQLVWMFLSESLAIITFAVILGIVVGVIVIYGNITASNVYINSYNLVTQRLVFPSNAFVVIGTYAALIYASTIGAILVMTSQYVTKLEKMVRTR
jgi:ABC-type lipoprotein release transport system permease subunit